MYKIALSLAFAIFMALSAYAQQPFGETLLFAYGVHALTDSAKLQLDSIATRIGDSKNIKITLKGHADGDGISSYNYILAKKRAETVKNYLTTKGINPNAIQYRSYGKDKPVASNDSEEGKQKNRRVVVQVDYYAIPEPVIHYTDTQIVAGDIFAQFDEPLQGFTANSQMEIKLTGSKGTEIRIPANSLVNKFGGPVSGMVNIRLKELYTKSDIVKAQLHTSTQQQMLETGGMVYITAHQAGNLLSLKSNTDFSIHFASQVESDGMKIYVGKTSPDSFTWEAMKNSRLGWICQARPTEQKSYTDVSIAINTDYKPTVYLMLKELTACKAAIQTQEGLMRLDRMPIGAAATLLAMSLVDGVPYYAVKDIILSKDQKIDLSLSKTTLEVITESLNKLDAR